MKIGIDARMFSSEFTGIGRYVHELIENLVKLDKKHEYVVFMNQKGYESYTPSSKRITKVIANAKHYSVAEQISYFFLLRKHKLDLMHFTHFNAPVLYRKPSVVTIHDLTLSFFPGKKMNSWFYRRAYNIVLGAAVKHASKVIAVSKHTKRDLVELTHTSPSKIEVIYEGVSDNFGPREDKDLTLDISRKYNITKEFMLYTGVWRSHKNLVNLIKGFAQLQEDEGFESQLVITGQEDPYYPEVKRTVQELGLEHDVIFTGMVPEEELVGLYQAAKLYVFPSLYEGFGLPPLEAMRCGTAVVASKSSCIPEICGEDNALYFDPYDSADIATTIRRVWIDDELRAGLRSRGLKHSRKFLWEKMAEETLAVYKDVLS
jgi:glycosyltransferase involved in cell wall biosynthesis